MASKDPPKPSAKVNADKNFEARLRELKTHAYAEYMSRRTGGQVRWSRPADWDGDLFQLQEIEKPFSREQANQEGMSAISHPDAPGVVGDVVAASTMIETLSIMERAYRLRHTMRRPRAMAHMLSRKKGHGDDKGAFVQNGIEYLRGMMTQARS